MFFLMRCFTLERNQVAFVCFKKCFTEKKKTQESEESEEELEAKKVRGIAKAFHEFLQLDSHGPLHQEGCKVDVWNFGDINILKNP